jgi:CheY-like chemotaxis protein
MASGAVLIIDDDSDFRELVRLYFESAGVEVLEAPDCPRGIAVLREERERVALVLLDYWMPNMDPARCCSCIPRSCVRRPESS